ncbi:MAG: zinc ribbon domain-containing protein [Chloroflexi bacterium]|nr:zinc ribbon domain-containing protein [Chloroflexota bacterium]
MPIYEYHCGKCSNDFELMRPLAKMTATAKCPQCGARGRRKLTTFAFVRGADADSGPSDFGDGDFGGLGGGGDDDDDFDMGGDFDF